jgi:Ni,Fe-hydrogenase III large subunit
VTLRNGEAVTEGSIERAPAARFRRSVIDGGAAGGRLAALFGRDLPGGAVRIYGMLADDAAGRLSILASDVRDSYEALTPDFPQAHYFEREIFEQHGVRPVGHPWLKPVRRHDTGYPFFRIESEEVHEVAVGPVHAGIIDPGHFRLQCHGETVLHLEIRLGYQHRGVEEALVGGPDGRSALLAECAAGDTTLGHVLAWCQAVEAAAGCEVPARADAIRCVALELERIANHVGDLGGLGTDIGFLPTSAWFGRLRGEFLNLLMDLSGSRYGRGLVRPGGVLFDLTPPMADSFLRRLETAASELRQVAGLFFETPSVRSRLEGTGVLSRAACDELGLVGVAARACGSSRDVRRDHPIGLYRSGAPAAAVAHTGDVLARARVRWVEIERSLEFIATTIRSLPGGDLMRACAAPRPESLAVSMVEGWRGEIVHVAVADGRGRFDRYKIKDPSFQNWTGLAMALRDVPISDFPLCNKSFNLSYAGHDL